MRKRAGSSSAMFQPSSSSGESTPTAADEDPQAIPLSRRANRSSFVWMTLLVGLTYSCQTIYDKQFGTLPIPLSAEHAGKRGFSEVEALHHVKALTELGPHSLGSDALDVALQYVWTAAEEIKKTAHGEIDVEVETFHAKSGANRLDDGLFTGKTLVYSDLNHIVLRILPKNVSEAGENAILVSSHIDTVFSTEGAGDCSSCVAVMLELARGISHWAHGFKNGVIFLFNTGEEEGLNGAHSFITQHPLRKTICMAIDLEAMGIGGTSGIFQTGPNPWAIENYVSVAKYPSGQILAQDIFTSGAIKSSTDFQVYKEVAGLSGLDFAYADNTAVYHTKNDKFELLKPGSLQHLGENMLAFLLKVAASPQLSKGSVMGKEENKDQNPARYFNILVAASPQLPKGSVLGKEENKGQNPAIYFDILGSYMVVYRQSFATKLHNSVIVQSLLIWVTLLLMGGSPAVVSLALSCLSLILMWIFSLSFSVLVAVTLPIRSPTPVPYIASPWLAIGLFAAPAFLGAFTGQHVGFLIITKYLSHVYSMTRKQLSPAIRADFVKLEAERWLFKAGTIQWLILLIIGSYNKIGSSYLAVVWLVSPAFAYGLLEATLTPSRFPKPLKLATLLMGLAVPILLSAGVLIRFASTLIGSTVRFVRNPGSNPEWLGNVIVAAFIAVVMCLTFVFLLSYLHLSGAKRSVVFAACILSVLSLTVVVAGIVPPFTEDTARLVNVVHVVDTTGRYGQNQDPPISYVLLFSATPGKLTKEAKHIKEGFICGRDKTVDFVTFSVKYGCWTSNNGEDGWIESDIPVLSVDSDTSGDVRITQVSIDTRRSTRWSLAINTDEIKDFKLTGQEELVPLDDKRGVDGWHVIQFSGGKNAPTRFDLTLFWSKNSTRLHHNSGANSEDQPPLLKLRTDVNRLTPKIETVISKLPSWCSQFGKSTYPHTLAFLSSLPVNF